MMVSGRTERDQRRPGEHKGPLAGWASENDLAGAGHRLVPHRVHICPWTPVVTSVHMDGRGGQKFPEDPRGAARGR